MGAKGAKQNQTKPNDSLHFVNQTEITIQNYINKNNKIKSNRVRSNQANFQLSHVIIISTGFGICFNWFSGAISNPRSQSLLLLYTIYILLKEPLNERINNNK